MSISANLLLRALALCVCEKQDQFSSMQVHLGGGLCVQNELLLLLSMFGQTHPDMRQRLVRTTCSPRIRMGDAFEARHFNQVVKIYWRWGLIQTA